MMFEGKTMKLQLGNSDIVFGAEKIQGMLWDRHGWVKDKIGDCETRER